MCFWGEGAEKEGWRAKDTQGERIFQKERVREAVEAAGRGRPFFWGPRQSSDTQHGGSSLLQEQ